MNRSKMETNFIESSRFDSSHVLNDLAHGRIGRPAGKEHPRWRYSLRGQHRRFASWLCLPSELLADHRRRRLYDRLELD